MTDRDLFHCTFWQCDGHARSNETCADGNEPEPAPKYTVSGNAISVQRLDAEGNPTGEPIDLAGSLTHVAFGLPSEGADDMLISHDLKSVSIDLTLSEVDPELLRLLTGQSRIEVIDIWEHVPWWRRLPFWWRRPAWRKTATVPVEPD